jgi:phosphinothricin acetyltransferase
VYVSVDARGRGVARALYSTLFGILEDLSYFTALAGIALPNVASVALHEAMGFAPIGIYRKVGYKLGAWHDVGWWQRALRPYVEDPTRPRTMRDYRSSASLRKRLLGSSPPK